MKLLILFGTRPEAIKMAPLIHELRRGPEFTVLTCSTGQHSEMLKQVLDFFGINPDFDLSIMQPNQSLPALSRNLILSLDQLLDKVQPDLILVQGDTTTTFISSLSAFYRRIRVGHVEAGLRSGNKWSPYPEEMNRILTTKLSDLHFAPTKKAANCLLAEGVCSDSIHVVGNTVVDALFYTLGKLNNAIHPVEEQFPKIDFNKRIVLVTAHRRESFGEPFLNICQALKELAQNDDVEIVYPVHMNPNVQDPVYAILGKVKNIHLLKPLGYPDLVRLMLRSYIILTDSGGIQEEAPSLCKPVLVMRNVTERLEGVESNVTRLVGTSKEKIVFEVRKLLSDSGEYNKMAVGINPYGDGKASVRIREILLSLEDQGISRVQVIPGF